MRIFDVLTIRIVDFFEIALVAFVLYRLYVLMRRGTLAMSILAGALALYVFQIVAQLTDMRILSAMFESLSDVYLLAAIVVFHPEIRRILRLFVQNPLIRRVFGSAVQQVEISGVIQAAETMSRTRVGGLIVFKRLEGLNNYTESGQYINAEISRDLIISIFSELSPLHDGALIISEGRIEAAGCILPVSKNLLIDSQYGTRHRAALGLTEETDAVVLVVSEETGNLSVCRNGVIKTGFDSRSLQVLLEELLSSSANNVVKSGRLSEAPS